MSTRFIIPVIWMATMLSSSLYAQNCQLINASQTHEACTGGTYQFYPDCTGLWNPTYQWNVRREGGTWQDAGYNESLFLTVTEPGKYYIGLVVREEESDFSQTFYDDITIYDSPNPPVIHLDKLGDICYGDNVTLSVQSPQPGLSYSWSSNNSAFSAQGLVATVYNITEDIRFFLEASNGHCSATQLADVSVSISGHLGLDPVMYYHRRILNTGSPSGYLQTSSTGTRTDLGQLSNYIITEPNTFYLRTYTEYNNCWAPASPGVSVTEFNYVPPAPNITQIYAIGYNSTKMSIDDKAFVLQFADFYWVDGVNSTTILNTYADGNRITESGTYYVRGRDKGTGTWGPTTTISVNVFDSENALNWVRSKTFDGTSDLTPSAENISYFDAAGKPVQTQTKIHTENRGDFIFASQGLRDRYDRTVGSTLPAPIQSKNFHYTPAFLLNESGSFYGPADFDVQGSTLYQPNSVSEATNTVGWYYSSSNTLEDHVPTTSYPYSRKEFYDDGSGEVKRGAGPGDLHRLGNGHELLTGTFPVYHELDDYLAIRRDNQLVNVADNLSGTSLVNNGVQSIFQDQNGSYVVTITDKSGNTVMSARLGIATDNVLQVTNTIFASGDPASPNYQPMIYFYILQPQTVSITESADFVAEDIINNIKQSPGQTFADGNNQWPIGFYRIILNKPSSKITFSYTHYFIDVSYQFYDDAGRLKSSISPNGYVQLRKNNIDYASIDKTTYQRNHLGWLLSMTEPDGGTTRYKYRRDGKIRFSQNAQQLENESNNIAGTGKFSYTNYDALGRPQESGEYIGTQTFSTISTQVEFDSQIQYTTTDKKDWVRTYYDTPDTDFQITTGLPSDYVQNFVRNTISHSANANIHTWYSYDEMGRVAWTAQKPILLPRVFVMRYTYDFLGNVLTVSNLTYNTSGVLIDQIYHRYEYDANKRLSKAYTSSNNKDQKLRATYRYYLHGPLKRIELGDKLQGVDFVYNINGWLTQINHPDMSLDPGQDSPDNNGFHEDVFGMVLDYYENALGEIVPIAVNPNETNDPLQIHHLPNLDKINMQEQFAGTGIEQMKTLLESLKHLRSEGEIAKPETTTEN